MNKVEYLKWLVEFLKTSSSSDITKSVEAVYDSIVVQAIAEHEAAQWHKYPEEKPDAGKRDYMKTKTVVIRCEVPEDAELFSVSYRIPIAPYGLLGYSFLYMRNKDVEIIPRPTDEDIYQYAEFQVPIEHEDAFPYVAQWFRSRLWGLGEIDPQGGGK